MVPLGGGGMRACWNWGQGAFATSSLYTRLSLCLADVNECELMLAVCGAALCENVEGSFLCLCASDLEEYDAQEGRCRPRVAGGETWETQAPSLPDNISLKV